MGKSANITRVNLEGLGWLRIKSVENLDMGGIEREDVEANEPGDFTEKPKAGMLECKLVCRSDTLYAELDAWPGGTIIAEFDTGNRWVGANGYRKGTLQKNKDELTLSFGCPRFVPEQ